MNRKKCNLKLGFDKFFIGVRLKLRNIGLFTKVRLLAGLLNENVFVAVCSVGQQSTERVCPKLK